MLTIVYFHSSCITDEMLCALFFAKSSQSPLVDEPWSQTAGSRNSFKIWQISASLWNGGSVLVFGLLSFSLTTVFFLANWPPPPHSADSLPRAEPEPQGRLSEAARGGEGDGDVGRRPPLAGRRTPRSSRHGRRVQPPGTNVKCSNISSPPRPPNGQISLRNESAVVPLVKNNYTKTTHPEITDKRQNHMKIPRVPLASSEEHCTVTFHCLSLQHGEVVTAKTIFLV